ncbi:MAG: zinc ABC transporter substrate-binding protein [Alphaproteobacteria bacterium]|nr:zinc ABC transporter substrate-binding protein [Alphaproteobacteria bacterium]
MLARPVRIAVALVLALGAVLFLALGPARAAEKPKVVATFSILGDIVAAVGRDMIELTVLVGPDGDAHVYQPTPADAKAVAQAQLIVVNGLGFEGWIDRLVKAARTKGTVVAASQGIQPQAVRERGRAHGHGHDHGHGAKGKAPDPHAWQDLRNGAAYARTIAAALASIDAGNAAAYRANGEAYAASLLALDAEIRAAFAAIPRAQRKVVTAHDAFGYFSTAYGVDFVAPVGVSTEAEASAGDVAKLIRQIKKERIGAVFVETVTDKRLAEQIVRETGARMGGTLYADALSKAGGPADSYVKMFRHNARQLVEALAGKNM